MLIMSTLLTIDLLQGIYPQSLFYFTLLHIFQAINILIPVRQQVLIQLMISKAHFPLQNSNRWIGYAPNFIGITYLFHLRRLF